MQGEFVIRDSSEANAVALSMYAKGQVRHYKLTMATGGYGMLGCVYVMCWFGLVWFGWVFWFLVFVRKKTTKNHEKRSFVHTLPVSYALEGETLQPACQTLEEVVANLQKTGTGLKMPLGLAARVI
jgi:hypothetical protein